MSGNHRYRIGVRKGKGDEIELEGQSKDRAYLAHAAVKIGAGISVLMCFLVLVIVMANMLDHRIMLMLTVRTHRRCSCLQGHHGDQHKSKEGSHGIEV